MTEDDFNADIWLKIPSIKRRLRPNNVSTEVVKTYLDGAIKMTLSCINRTEADIVSEYGRIPLNMKRAVMIATVSILNSNKGIQSNGKMLPYVPFKYDVLLKPFIRL